MERGALAADAVKGAAFQLAALVMLSRELKKADGDVERIQRVAEKLVEQAMDGNVQAEDAMARFVVARVTSGDGERKAMAAERARRYRQRRKQAQKGGWQQG
jgi:hypothetical protein